MREVGEGGQRERISSGLPTERRAQYRARSHHQHIMTCAETKSRLDSHVLGPVDTYGKDCLTLVDFLVSVTNIISQCLSSSNSVN